MYACWQSCLTVISCTLHASGINFLQRAWRFKLTIESAKKLNRGQDVMFEARLTSASQTVRAYVMCDGIGKQISLLIFAYY